MITDLPERLRLGTRELHARTERTGFMAALLDGRIEAAGYAALLRNLHALYDALETALRRSCAVPAVAAVRMPELDREPALAADLDTLVGAGWRERPVVPATQVYVQRLQALAAHDPPRLVAHVYVRCLGDLHGGQVLRRLVARGLGLADERGLRFYDHGPVEQVLARRAALRCALGKVPVDEAGARAILDEACWAFERHCELFEQLHMADCAPPLR